MSKFSNPFIFLQKNFVLTKKYILLISVLTIAVSATVWGITTSYYNSIAKQKFENAVNQNIESIRKSMFAYESKLMSGVAFFRGSENVSRQEWHDFVETLDIRNRYPGMHGIGFSKMIHPDEVALVEQAMRSEGFSTFTITPKGNREIYSSILYLEPMDKRNMAAIGYDMFSESVRREAMQTARDTGSTALSKKATLIQEIDSDVQAGVLMYLPLYKKDAKTSTPQQRREALIGFIYSPFRMNDLMHNITLKTSMLNIKICDSQDTSNHNLLYKSYESLSHKPKFQTEKLLQIYNQVWHIHFFSTKEFDDSAGTMFPILMTAIGITIQFGLFFIILLLLKSRNVLNYQAIELAKLSQAIKQSPSSVVMTNLDGEIVYANDAFTKTTLYPLHEAIGKNPSFLQSGKTDKKTYEEMWSSLKAGKEWFGEFTNLKKDGTEYVESVKASPIFQADGTISNYMAIKEDITDKKRTEEQIYFLANFDMLTALPNRYQLDKQVILAISKAKRNSEQLCIMFLDLDKFKEINDSLGHDAGDALLKEMANRFKSVLREVDMVSRVGGDEFIFLLEDTDASGALHVAQKLIETAKIPFGYKGENLQVSASIGIAIYPRDGIDKETLFKNADSAMYRAKQSGRDKYCFFTD